MESYTFREALFPSAVHRYLKEHKVDFSQLLQEAAVSNGLASDLTFCENRKAASARLVETVGPFWCKSQNEQAILLPLHDKSGLKELKNLLQNAASFFSLFPRYVGSNLPRHRNFSPTSTRRSEIPMGDPFEGWWYTWDGGPLAV